MFRKRKLHKEKDTCVKFMRFCNDQIVKYIYNFLICFSKVWIKNNKQYSNIKNNYNCKNENIKFF